MTSGPVGHSWSEQSATVAQVAHAADVLDGVPRGVVGLGVVVEDLLHGEAHAAAVAVVGADGTLARDAVVVVEALALAGLAVADALVGALDVRVGGVGGRGDGDPGGALGARALRAVVVNPGGIAVRAVVADALVVLLARTVAGAAVGAVSGHR